MLDNTQADFFNPYLYIRLTSARSWIFSTYIDWISIYLESEVSFEQFFKKFSALLCISVFFNVSRGLDPVLDQVNTVSILTRCLFKYFVPDIRVNSVLKFSFYIT